MNKQLNALATELVGDGKRPNLYFVSNAKADCIMVTSDAKAAYSAWKQLAFDGPLAECTLEDRLTGTICSVEPVEDEPNAPLVTWDDSKRYMRSVHA